MLMLPVSVENGVHVGEVLLATLRELQMERKEVWRTCGYTEGDFSLALTGRKSLDLWKLRELPLRFWLCFLGRFLNALIWQHPRNLNVPIKMAHAELRKPDTERKVS